MLMCFGLSAAPRGSFQTRDRDERKEGCCCGKEPCERAKKPGSVSTDLASNDRCNYRQTDIAGGNAEYVKSKKKTKKREG